MSKFTIKYEVEALTLNDALQTAYEIVFLASADVDSVKVEPVEKQKSDLTFADVPTETNPSIYDHIYHPLAHDDSVVNPNRIIVTNNTDFTD